MKKTVSAALGGIQFTFTEDSYQQLSIYLDSIKKSLEPTYRDETLHDIESRCAEILSERLLGRQVVEHQDIEHIISIMGKPSDFSDESTISDIENSSSIERRKVFRDPDGNILGGVASGISYYFGIHVALVRLIFIILAIISGFGILTYIILWIILPKATSSVDKLMMKGEKIHFKKIEETIKNELSSINKKSVLTENMTSYKWLNRIFNFVGNIVGYALRFSGKLIAVLLIIPGIILLILFLMLFISSFAYLSGSFEVNSYHFSSEHINEYLKLFFGSKTSFSSAILTLILLISSLVVIIAFSVRWLFGRRRKINKKVILFSVLIFLLSSLYFILFTYQFSSNFKHSSTNIVLSEMIPFKNMDTVYVTPVISDIPLDISPYVQNGIVYSKNIQINIDKSFDSNINILSKVEAKGPNKQAAFSNSQNIQFDVKVEKNNIQIPISLSYPSQIGFRSQKAYLNIFLPENTIIYLPDAFNYEYNKDYTAQIWNFTSGYYKMTTDGLMKIN